MSFHKRTSGDRGMHLNRAHNIVEREPDAVADRKAAVAAAQASAAEARASSLSAFAAEQSSLAAKNEASAAAAAAASSAHASAAAAAASTTSQVFPVPKGTNPFGLTFTTTSASSSVASSTTPSVVPTPKVTSQSTSSSHTVAKALSTSSTQATPTPSSANASTPSEVTTTSKGISSAAVGGIVTVVVIAVLAIGVFFSRKYIKRRRDLKRNTWSAGLVPALENKRSTLYGNDSEKKFTSEKPLPFSPDPVPLAIPPNASPISVPPALYNSNASVAIPPFVPPTIQSPSASSSSMPAATSVEVAVVTRTFVPNLPDELHISTGEHIRLLSAFDDGWALCANIRGDQGVVPLECLQRGGNQAQMEMQLQPESEFGYDSNRAAKRLSSLIPNNPATY